MVYADGSNPSVRKDMGFDSPPRHSIHRWDAPPSPVHC